MKKFIVILSVFFTTTFSNSIIAQNILFAKIDTNTDYFMLHYKKLLTTSPYNEAACKASVFYMESFTGLKAHTDGDYFGALHYSRINLIEWKKWYDESKEIFTRIKIDW